MMKKTDFKDMVHGDVFVNITGNAVFVVLIDTDKVKRIVSFSGERRDLINTPRVDGKRIVLFNIKDLSPALIKLAKKYDQR